VFLNTAFCVLHRWKSLVQARREAAWKVQAGLLLRRTHRRFLTHRCFSVWRSSQVCTKKYIVIVYLNRGLRAWDKLTRLFINVPNRMVAYTRRCRATSAVSQAQYVTKPGRAQRGWGGCTSVGRQNLFCWDFLMYPIGAGFLSFSSQYVT